jgi:RimJ/RimL family protein N-acetyltransferase
MMYDPGLLACRPLTADDLPLLYRWINEDHVARWYGDEAGLPYKEIALRYDPRSRGEAGVQQFLITYAGQPIGQIQTYMVTDPLEYGGPALVHPGTAAVDLLIGDPRYVHHGLGAPILRRFLREVVFGTLGATRCLIDPEMDNASAIRCYEKAGFRHAMTFRRADSRMEIALLCMDRADLLATDPTG